MINSALQDIVRQRETRNELMVSIVRFALGLTIIVNLLSYLQLIRIGNSAVSLSTLGNSIFLFVYATLTLIILLRRVYLPWLKFFVIFCDYTFIFLSFISDQSLTKSPDTAVWYAFAGCAIFYLINLLRYSKAGTIFAFSLSLFTYAFVTIQAGVPLAIVLQVSIPLLLLLYIGYSVTISSKKMMAEANTKTMMERYLPPQLVQELYKDTASLDSGGSIKKVSVVFSDIRSFSTLSEQLPPQQVVSLLNQYLSLMTDIIFANKGTIDKFIGDAIMTVFGAPVSTDDDTLRAIRTAVAMQKAMLNFNAGQGNLPASLEIGVGIHTGEVIAGNIGSDKRMDYTVIGDSVNLASRIEGLTRHYKCPILISETTYGEAKDQTDEFRFREIDLVRVKGRNEPVRIYEVCQLMDQADQARFDNMAKVFACGLNLYRNRDFKNASLKFKEIHDDPVASVFDKRCQIYALNPPDPGWAGIFSMRSK